jgi:hypothetical protein
MVHQGFNVWNYPIPGSGYHRAHTIRPAAPKHQALCLPCSVETAQLKTLKLAKGCLIGPDPPCTFCRRVLAKEEVPVIIHSSQEKKLK